MPSLFSRALALTFTLLVSFAASHRAAALSAPEIRTPPASPSPSIHGPRVYGARPAHEFIYRIPCTGTRPMQFSAKGLPSGLKLDANTGIIRGQSPQKAGEYALTIKATNAMGRAERPFKLVVGDKLGLTPQMGWNDWYTFYTRPTDADIRGAADKLISTGMADYGYQFVDIDDAWEHRPGWEDPAFSGAARNADGNILPNTRFPDMPALTAYIHSLGLRAGIYSSPGPLTCARFEASYGHEQADAAQIAKWGFDLFKYDMCSYGSLLKDRTNVDELKAPYIKMGALVQHLDRDVIFNMCQYGMGESWKWARSVGGSSWRTTGDVGLEKASGLPPFYSIGFKNAVLDQYAGPGGWNDPDYLIIGVAGDAHNQNASPHASTLTPDEQYSYMSMWSLMAAPLFFSGDMARLDPFTLNILENAEVIDVDQDSLGKQGRVVRRTADDFVLAKPLEDGSMAVGLFNISSAPLEVAVDLQDLGFSGKAKVRDIWKQQDMGMESGKLSATIAPHGVMMVRVAGHKTLT